MTTTTTQALTVEGVGPVDVTVTERGTGRTFLLLHGGAGPQSVAGFADLLAESEPARVVTPTHPGFGGTPRPEAFASVHGLAALYIDLLDALELDDVTVIGNSIGGWIASEMAILGSPRITGLVLVDAVGIEVDGHPVADFFALTLDEVSRLSYHDPVKFRIDPSTMPPALQQAMAGNRASLAAYAGAGTGSMLDPTLKARLGTVTIPTLVVWGDSDQIVDPEYGRAFAAAIPSARFELLTDTGHVPQIETPQRLLTAISSFAKSYA
jgi:pimeloyl-ACP methyl ester carboxylesterase